MQIDYLITKLKIYKLYIYKKGCKKGNDKFASI